MEEDAAAAVVAAAAVPDSWEATDLDNAMSRLLLSSSSGFAAAACRVSSSPDLVDDHQVDAQQQADDPVAQVDQFLREALDKPRERLSDAGIRCCSVVRSRTKK